MESIIQKFQNIYLQVKAEKGSLFLFMVLKMDEFTDKWSVFVSGLWITNDNLRENFDYIANKITRTLTPAEIPSIARIGIFSPDEHLVSVFTETIRVEGGGPVKLENTRVNGYQVHEAYVFEAVLPQSTPKNP